MSNKIFHSIAILGVGLIGGSLGLAVKAAGSVAEVRGWGRNSARLQRALDLGAVDTVTSDLAEVLHGVDCAIIATPTQHAEQLLLETLNAASDTTIISDVASVKANLADALQLAACAEAKKAQVVLAHPIAGSEQSGVEAASATLFNDQRVILTPLANTRPGAVDKVSALWRSVGAQLHSMDAELHDRVLGHTSHLPHVLAYALVDYLNRQPESELMFTFAGGGFRDFTRIAASDPRMWREISLANREALLDALRGYQGQLQLMVDALENSDGDTLEASFGRAKTARDAFKPGE